MSPCSSSKTPLQLENCLVELERMSSYSKADGCMVVEVICAKCSAEVSEELEAAREAVTSGGDFLCLACDWRAVASAIVGLKLSSGYMLVFDEGDG